MLEPQNGAGENQPVQGAGQQPINLFDKDGKPVEGALTPEAATKLQTELQQKSEALSKLEVKDFNFDRYRKSETAEKAEMVKGWDKEKMILLNQMELLVSNLDNGRTALIEQTKKDTLKKLCGDNEELKTKVEETAKTLIAGEPQTPEEMIRKLENAFTYMQGANPGISPLHQFVPNNGVAPAAGQQLFIESEAGKAIYQSLFGRPPITEVNGQPIAPASTYKL